jgi:carbonyl reductase 1
MAGHLHKYSQPIQDQFLAAKTVPEVTKLMENFKQAVKDGNEKEQGWISAGYAVSKAGVTGMTRAVAFEQQGKGSKVLINSCCPGYVNTDMTKGRGPKTVDAGAKTPVMLALGDIGGKSGEFWQDERVKEW